MSNPLRAINEVAARPVSSLPPGAAFARIAWCLSKAKGDGVLASRIAEATWGPNAVTNAIKQAVAAGGTQSPNWASPIADYTYAVRDFIEAVRPYTILGRLQGVRKVPFNVKVPRETTAAGVGWVGQGSPAPVGYMNFDQVTLDVFKVAGLVVATQELARISAPNVDLVLRADLIAGVAAFCDRYFIDPTFAGEAGVSPAAVNYGAPTVPATGTTLSALRTDLRALIKLVTDQGIDLRNPYFITDRNLCMKLAMMDSNFTRDVKFNGGLLAGIPILSSSSSPSGGANSPSDGTSTLTLIDAAELLLADSAEATIDYSEEGDLQMESAPDNPPTDSTVRVSLYQNGLGAWRITRPINYKMGRAAVASITNANYAE